MTTPTTTTTIAAAEVWTADAGDTGLTLTARCGAAARGDAEVLPWQSWSRRVPLLDEAGSAAIPLFCRGRVTSVVVLRGREAEDDARGGVELWTRRRDRFELSLAASRYFGLARFGLLSRYVNFPRGGGLPGVVWERAEPCFIDDLGASPQFLRSTGAANEGLDVGFGFPVIDGLELKGVMVFLAARHSPFAARCEVCRPGVGDGPAREAAASRRPVLEDAALAIPVLVHDEVTAVALLAW